MHWPTNDGWKYPPEGSWWQPKDARQRVELYVEVVTQQIVGCVTIMKTGSPIRVNMPWEDFYFQYEQVPEEKLAAIKVVEE